MTVALPVWGVADALAARPAQPTNEGMPVAAMPCKIQQSTTYSLGSCKEDSGKQRHSKPRHSKPRHRVDLRASPHCGSRTLPRPGCKARQLTGDNWLHSCTFRCKHDTVWISEDRLQRLRDALQPRHVGTAEGATD